MDEKTLNWPVTITLFNQQELDGEWMPGKLTDAIVWLEKFLEQVPEKYRDTAGIEIDSESEYDCCYVRVTISYSRPPTNAERQERLAGERQQKEGRDAQDRREYERLKAKFDD